MGTLPWSTASPASIVALSSIFWWKSSGRGSFIMQSKFEPIIRAVRLLAAERAELSGSGPRFLILHRFWVPETLCTPGEAIAEIRLLHRTREIPVPLSLRLMLLFDYLARHKHLGQHAGQIAAGFTVDLFTRQHGAYAGAKGSLSKRVSRTAVKQQIMRLRAGLRWAFRKAGLSLDPTRVLISEPTAANEVRYRLRASVSWIHTEL